MVLPVPVVYPFLSLPPTHSLKVSLAASQGTRANVVYDRIDATLLLVLGMETRQMVC